MNDVYEVREVKKDEQMRVVYSQPKFWHRCMANFVDFFIFALFTVMLFISVRTIVQSTDGYKEVQNKIDNIQLRSGLYRRAVSDNSSTSNVDIIYYLDTYEANTPAGKEFDTGISDDPQFLNGKCIKSILTFIDYCKDQCSNERYEELVSYYDEARLTPTYDGIHYFVTDESNNIVPNQTLVQDATKLKAYYNNVYKPFIENRCIPFLSANVPGYHELVMVDYNLLIFLELPIAYFVAAILVYFVPPLFFRRGRMTLGKALYHIGLIDRRLLSPTFPRFLARFAILFFSELLLSLFSFGLPYIISFSMMAFSKKKQGFPDYMLSLLEVDTSKSDIYMDYVEAATKNQLYGKPVDFKPEQPL